MIDLEYKPTKSRKIYEEITEQLRLFILEEKFNPGDRLPSERDLAERLQVSRASLREALSALKTLGLLEGRVGYGTCVSNVNFNSLDKDSIKQLMEVRKTLEIQTVSLAAERACNTDLEQMAKVIEEMFIYIEAGKFDEVKDEQFHFSIAQATHNKVSVRMINSISDNIHQISKFGFTTKEELIRKLFHEHVGIYEAIKAKDPVTARERMLAHLVETEDALLNTNGAIRENWEQS